MQSSYECVHVLRVLLPSWPQKRVYSNRRKPVSMICTLTPINARNLNVAAKNCTDNFIKLVLSKCKKLSIRKIKLMLTESWQSLEDTIWLTRSNFDSRDVVSRYHAKWKSTIFFPNASKKCYSTEKRPYEFINKSAIIKKIILVYLFPKWKRKMWIWKEQS